MTDNNEITDQSLANYIKDLPSPTNEISVTFTISARENGYLSFASLLL